MVKVQIMTAERTEIEILMLQANGELAAENFAEARRLALEARRIAMLQEDREAMRQIDILLEKIRLAYQLYLERLEEEAKTAAIRRRDVLPRNNSPSVKQLLGKATVLTGTATVVTGLWGARIADAFRQRRTARPPMRRRPRRASTRFTLGVMTSARKVRCMRKTPGTVRRMTKRNFGMRARTSSIIVAAAPIAVAGLGTMAMGMK